MTWDQIAGMSLVAVFVAPLFLAILVMMIGDLFGL
jgi:hypothetical protein